MSEHTPELNSLTPPGPTLLQRVVAWLIFVVMIGLGVMLLTTALFVGGIVLLAAAAIVGARSLWRRIRRDHPAGRENVRVIVRR